MNIKDIQVILNLLAVISIVVAIFSYSIYTMIPVAILCYSAGYCDSKIGND